MNCLKLLPLTGIFIAAFAFGLSAKTLTIGSISTNPRQEIAKHQQFIEVLTPRLAPLGVTQVDLKVLPDAKAIGRAMAIGQVDLFLDSPVLATQVIHASGAKPFLLRWKGGVRTYHSIIFTRENSPIRSLADLQGRLVGFEERASSSGFLLPVAMIIADGHETQELPPETTALPEDVVNFVFTEDDRNTLLWMIRNKIDAAGTDSLNFRQLDEARPGQYRILAQSPAMPRQLALHSPDLAPDFVARLSTVLENLDNDTVGRDMLLAFDNTLKFEAAQDLIDKVVSDLANMLTILEDAGVTQ